MFKHLANVIFSPIIIDFYEFLGHLVKFNTINLYKAKVFGFSGDFFFLFHFQSGKIHFYNTTTQKRTWKDPRDKVEKDDDDKEDDNSDNGKDIDMSLDLELNLTCESLDKNNNNQTIQGGRRAINNGMIFGSSENYNNNNNKAEMVAAVCMRCHLLVMLCKSSPECPNCKFMNSPPEQTTPAMFKRRCHLSW